MRHIMKQKKPEPPIKQNSSTAAPVSAGKKWGYWSGGGLCALGLILLAIALGQAMRAATRGLVKARFPGVQQVNLAREGLYLGVFPTTGNKPVAAEDLERMSVSLKDENTGFTMPVEKAPAAMVVMGGKRGVVLFQTEISTPGRFTLEGSYAGGPAGPSLDLFLIHESLGSSRADVVVGGFLFLFLEASGIVVLWKTFRGPKTRD